MFIIPVGVSSETKPSLEARPLSFALTPSPSPKAWEREVERVCCEGRSPSPATRERGQGVRAAIRAWELPRLWLGMPKPFLRK